MVNWPGYKSRAKKKEQPPKSPSSRSPSSTTAVPAAKRLGIDDDQRHQHESFTLGADMLQHLKDLDEDLRLSLAVLVGQNALSFPAQLGSRGGSDVAWARDLIHEVVVDCFDLADTLVPSIYNCAGVSVIEIDFASPNEKADKSIGTPALSDLLQRTVETQRRVKINKSTSKETAKQQQEKTEEISEKVEPPQHAVAVWLARSVDDRCKALDALLLHQVLFQGLYDARLRVCLRTLCRTLHVPWGMFAEREERTLGVVVQLAESLARQQQESKQANSEGSGGQDETKAKPRNYARWAKIGLAGVTAGTLIAVTGGLAAPAIAAGFTTVGSAIGMGAAAVTVGGFIASVGGTALLTTAFGLHGMSLAGYKMAKITQNELDEFSFEELDQRTKLEKEEQLDKEKDKEIDGSIKKEKNKNLTEVLEEESDTVETEAIAGTQALETSLNSVTSSKPASPKSHNAAPIESQNAPSKSATTPAVSAEGVTPLSQSVTPSAADEVASKAAAASVELNGESLGVNTSFLNDKGTTRIVAASTICVNGMLTSFDQWRTVWIGQVDEDEEQETEGEEEEEEEEEEEAISGKYSKTEISGKVSGEDVENISEEDVLDACAEWSEKELSKYAEKKNDSDVLESKQTSTTGAVDEPTGVDGLESDMIEVVEEEGVAEDFKLTVNSDDHQVRALRQSNVFVLVYDRKILLDYGTAASTMALWQAKGFVVSEVLKRTVLAGLMAAVAIPKMIETAAGVIDNPWSVAQARADVAGKELARALMMQTQGARPVTLVGYGLGARVIFYALLELARNNTTEPDKVSRKDMLRGTVERRYGSAFGLIQDVVLLGSTMAPSAQEWKEVRSIVAGHLVNGYCTTDIFIALLYRTTPRRSVVAGLGAVKCSGVLDVNLRPAGISSHSHYLKQMTTVLLYVEEQVALDEHSESS